METIAWIGFSQGLFAAIIMLAKRGVSISDKILTAWLALLAIEFLTCAIDYRYYGVPLLTSSFLLLNPAFYLYSTSLAGGPFKLKLIQLMHLFPFLFFEISAYVLKESYSIRDFFTPNANLWFRYSFSIASVVSWVAYNWATINVILKHRKRLVNEFSTIESNKRISWLLFIVIFYNLYCMVLIAVTVSSIVFRINFSVSPVYNYSALLLMVYIFGFYGLRQGTIFMDTVPDEDVKDKYIHSILSEERKNAIRNLLLEYFNKKRPYLNPELNMNMLSDELKVPKYQLTEVLNILIKKNFFQFVNEYRVEAVKKMLLKNTGYSIEAIGYECGFNSKSTFFTVFKNIAGLTPLQYRQTMNNKY
jgi:AraC-like DNA-binding protein